MQQQTVLSDNEVLLSPCGYGSMTVSQTIPSEGSMVMHIHKWLPPLAFTPWIFSRYHELFENTEFINWWPNNYQHKFKALKNTT